MVVKKVYFKTFGCRTNQFDTQVMMSKVGNMIIVNDELESDIVVVNSCTVTNGADSSVRQYIASLKRKNSDVKIILAGCGSHSKGEELFDDEAVFGVMGHSEKEKLGELLLRKDRFYEIGDLEHIDSTVVESFVGKSRAFIKIQEGCDFECSYCIIPSVRGRARSHKMETILEQISLLATNGFGEFVLTGTNMGSYGKDIGLSLSILLKKISNIRGVRRIRLGSLEPIQIDSEMIELLKEPWMAKHLHIALQHTSDKMLGIMNRRNRFDDDLKLLSKVKDAGYAIGTDFIVGHPGEGEKEWAEAIWRVKELPLTHIHAFTYSKRDGTASAQMKENIVNGKIAKTRHQELVNIIKHNNLEFRKNNMFGLDILLESGSVGLYKGYDQYYNSVEVESSSDLKGNWIVADCMEVKDEKNWLKYF